MADCLNLLHFHLGSQITNIRQIKAAVNESVARVRGPGARRRRAEVPGRGRRPGRGLRRLADGFRIERQLHPPGIRQRHHLPRAETCATKWAWRTPPSSPRAAAPSPPITACLVFNVLGVAGMARPTCRPSRRRTPSSRSSTCRKPTARSPRRTCSKATTTRSRRSTRRSTCSASATFRSTSVASPRTSTGRFREESKGWRASWIISRRAGGHRRHALGHLLLQLLAVPKYAG